MDSQPHPRGPAVSTQDRGVSFCLDATLLKGEENMNLGEFIDTFKDAIAQRVVASYPPLYRPSENGRTLPRLLRKPLRAQEDAIRGTTVGGEMGTGKTFQ